LADERILIADDEPDVRALARYALEADGYDVTTVNDGLEAVERARAESFTLLLTDLKMPRMGGLESFETIRAFDPDIIGVVMTGFGTMKMAIEALKLGFDDFVIKPFSPTELAKSVGRSMAQARLRQENARLKALVPLFEISRSFMADHDLGTLLTQITTTAVAETKAVAGVLLGYDSDEGYLYLKASKGLSPPPHRPLCARSRPALAPGLVIPYSDGVARPGRFETANLRRHLPRELRTRSPPVSPDLGQEPVYRVARTRQRAGTDSVLGRGC